MKLKKMNKKTANFIAHEGALKRRVASSRRLDKKIPLFVVCCWTPLEQRFACIYCASCTHLKCHQNKL